MLCTPGSGGKYLAKVFLSVETKKSTCFASESKVGFLHMKFEEPR